MDELATYLYTFSELKFAFCENKDFCLELGIFEFGWCLDFEILLNLELLWFLEFKICI